MDRQSSDVERADDLARRRSRVLMAVAVLFVAWQINYLAGDGNLARSPDHIKISAWLVWALALLVVLATGGGLLQPRALRRLMEDEGTKANRRSGIVAGFWAFVAAAVGVYVATMFISVSGRSAMHIILTAGVGVALIAFALLERRSLQDG